MNNLNISMTLANIEGSVMAEAAVLARSDFENDNCDFLEQLIWEIEVAAEDMFRIVTDTTSSKRTILQNELIRDIHRKALNDGIFLGKFRELQAAHTVLHS